MDVFCPGKINYCHNNQELDWFDESVFYAQQTFSNSTFPELFLISNWKMDVDDTSPQSSEEGPSNR